MNRLIEAGVSLKRRKEVVPTYPEDTMRQKTVNVVEAWKIILRRLRNDESWAWWDK